MTAPRPSLATRTFRVVKNPLSFGDLLGRNGRAILGAIVILADVALLFVDVFQHEAITVQDVGLHLGMFLGGLALIDREKAADLLRAWRGNASQ